MIKPLSWLGPHYASRAWALQNGCSFFCCKSRASARLTMQRNPWDKICNYLSHNPLNCLHAALINGWFEVKNCTGYPTVVPVVPVQPRWARGCHGCCLPGIASVHPRGWPCPSMGGSGGFAKAPVPAALERCWAFPQKNRSWQWEAWQCGQAVGKGPQIYFLSISACLGAWLVNCKRPRSATLTPNTWCLAARRRMRENGVRLSLA